MNKTLFYGGCKNNNCVYLYYVYLTTTQQNINHSIHFTKEKTDI